MTERFDQAVLRCARDLVATGGAAARIWIGLVIEVATGKRPGRLLPELRDMPTTHPWEPES